eukprot:m.149970 g.149970  ORF g.149970 m.149970 type:complete len:177 (+) comp38538_c0_seq12:1873-2403(+)
MFCPVLPTLGLLSSLLFFLVYYYIVKVTCRPPEKRWSQSRNNSFFLGVLVLTLCSLLFAVSVVLTRDSTDIALGGSSACDAVSLPMPSLPQAACLEYKNQTCCTTTCGPFETLPATNAIWRLVNDSRSRDVVENYVLSSTISLPVIIVALYVITSFIQYQFICDSVDESVEPLSII